MNGASGARNYSVLPSCWRSISKDNITIWYGKARRSRNADPVDPTFNIFRAH